MWTQASGLVGLALTLLIADLEPRREGTGIATSSAAGALWIGHEAVVGDRVVPILGRVKTRTETFVLAHGERRGDALVLVQRACHLALSNPVGAKLSLLPGAAERLPPVRLEFNRHRDGRWYLGPSVDGWRAEDVDLDAHPGLTIQVDAPICSGTLEVGIETTTMARGAFDPDGALRGQLRVRLRQTVLEAHGVCLSMLTRNTDDRAEGRFVYAPAPPGTTCKSFTTETWPVRAEP